MPYIKQKMRSIVDPHIEKLVERALRQGNITPNRIGNIIDAITLCAYQGRVPHMNRSSYVPIDTMICRDLIRSIIELPTEALYGALNYSITRFLMLAVVNGDMRYNKLQAVVEALEEARHYVNEKPLRALLICVENEFYRRVVAPYEQRKLIENGDVYEDSNLKDNRNVCDYLN